MGPVAVDTTVSFVNVSAGVRFRSNHRCQSMSTMFLSLVLEMTIFKQIDWINHITSISACQLYCCSHSGTLSCCVINFVSFRMKWMNKVTRPPCRQIPRFKPNREVTDRITNIAAPLRLIEYDARWTIRQDWVGEVFLWWFGCYCHDMKSLLI